MAAPSTSRSSPMATAPSAAPTCPPSPLNTPSSSPGAVSTCPRAPSGCVLPSCPLPLGSQREGGARHRCWLSLGPCHHSPPTSPSAKGLRLVPPRLGLVVPGEGALWEGHPLSTDPSPQVNVGEGSHPERVKVYGPGVEKTGLKANEPTYFTVDCSEAGQGAPGCGWGVGDKVWGGGLLLRLDLFLGRV